LDTYVKGLYKEKSFGEAELEIHTDAKASDTKAKVTFNQLFNGASVALSGNSDLALGLEANYTQDMVAAKLLVDQSDATKVTLAACFGMDGFTAGATSSVDLTGGNFALKGLDFGAQYQHGKMYAALATVKNQSLVKLSLYNSFGSSLAGGAAVEYKLKNSSTLITVGTDYSLDKATTVKGKATHTGALSFAVEHRLDFMKLAVSAELDALNLGAPASKFGLSVVYGDY